MPKHMAHVQDEKRSELQTRRGIRTGKKNVRIPNPPWRIEKSEEITEGSANKEWQMQDHIILKRTVTTSPSPMCQPTAKTVNTQDIMHPKRNEEDDAQHLHPPTHLQCTTS